jgi:hypothetical protein
VKIGAQVVVESDNGIGEIVQEIAQFERGQLRPEQLGLTMMEAKGLLEGLQPTVVEQQIAEYSKQQSSCPLCSKQRLRKGARTIVFGAIFGKIELSSPRLFHCKCQPQPNRSFSPLAELLVERTAPELLYLETKFASLVSYGLSMKPFEEVLPIGAEINASTIRNHTLAAAERLEGELGDEQAFFIEGCERDWEELPRPDMPLTVEIDGGYVDSCERKGKKDRRFEVIVGKSMTAELEYQMHATLSAILSLLILRGALHCKTCLARVKKMVRTLFNIGALKNGIFRCDNRWRGYFGDWRSRPLADALSGQDLRGAGRPRHPRRHLGFVPVSWRSVGQRHAYARL